MGQSIWDGLRQRQRELERELGYALNLSAPQDLGAALRRTKDTLDALRRISKGAPVQRTRSAPVANRNLVDHVLDRLDHSPTAKFIGGGLASAVSLQPAMTDVVLERAGDVVGAADFVRRALDPNDPSARQQLVQATSAGKAYVASRIADPGLAVDDAKSAAGHALHEANEILNPFAAPQADTFLGELERRRELTRRQAALVFDVMGPVKGGGAALTAMRARSYAQRLAGYVKKHPPSLARSFAEPYPKRGKGHHSLIPQRTFRRVAEWAAEHPDPRVQALGQRAKPLLRAIRDHPFNVRKFTGLDRGQAYREHSGIDRQYRGGGLGPTRWSADELDWQLYNPVHRLWAGTPEALKEAMAETSLIPIAVLRDRQEHEAP